MPLETVRNMRQNLAFAFVYNALGIPWRQGCSIHSPGFCFRQ